MSASLYVSLPMQAQTAYSELFEAARHASLTRSVADLHGSFSRKIVKGRSYWYFSFRDAVTGAVRQIYVGPDSDEVRQLTETAKRTAPATAAQLSAQVRAALALGCAGAVRPHFRIIRQLEEAGFFRAGGLLIGSHAFAAFGNLLGVRWGPSAHTLDIDFAISRHSAQLSLAVPNSIDVDVPSAVESLKMGFMPHSALGSASFASAVDIGLRIDFVTPAGRCGHSEFVEKLNIPLQPLKFLDYLLENPAQAVLLEANGGVVLVSIPDPARFAMHKLIVAGERPTSEAAKSRKDLDQAAALIDYFLDHAPHRLSEAHADARSRGSHWKKRLGRQTGALLRLHPHLHERWSEHFP